MTDQQIAFVAGVMLLLVMVAISMGMVRHERKKASRRTGPLLDGSRSILNGRPFLDREPQGTPRAVSRFDLLYGPAHRPAAGRARKYGRRYD